MTLITRSLRRLAIATALALPASVAQSQCQTCDGAFGQGAQDMTRINADLATMDRYWGNIVEQFGDANRAACLQAAASLQTYLKESESNWAKRAVVSLLGLGEATRPIPCPTQEEFNQNGLRAFYPNYGSGAGWAADVVIFGKAQITVMNRARDPGGDIQQCKNALQISDAFIQAPPTDQTGRWVADKLRSMIIEGRPRLAACEYR